MQEKLRPPDALLELHERDRAAGLDPMVTEVIEIGPPPGPLDQGLVIEPVDWEQEWQERQAAERALRAQQAQAQLEQELEQEAEPARPTPPAPRPSRWRRSTP